MADDLRLVAKFDDKASSGVKKLGKDLAGVKPTHGMAQAQKWFAEFRGEADKASKIVKPISGYMGAIGVTGLAASLSIGEMVKQFKELASQTLALKEIGRQTGLTTTEVKRLKYAASELSIDPDKMVAGLQVMSDKMADFHRGASELNGLLNNFDPDFSRKLMRDADDPQKELKDIVDWLAQIPAKQRAAGKSAADAAQAQKRWTEAFFGDGSLARIAATPGEFAAAMADAAKAVPEVTKAMEDQAKLLNKAVLDLNQSWDNLKNDVGPSVIHGMTEATDKLREAFDAIQKHPAEAVVGAGSFMALYARRRLMNAISGGAAGRAAGELAGAAQKQTSAGASLLEAATALKEAAASLKGKGGGGGAPGGSPEEKGPKANEEAPGGFSLGSLASMGTWLLARGVMTTAQIYAMTRDLPNQIQMLPKGRVKDDVYALPPAPTSTLSAQSYWARKQAYLDARNPFHPDDDDRQTRARPGEFSWVKNTDGNALRRNDDALSPVTAQELFQKVREGSKEGIVAGLREMAQEQDLSDPQHNGVGGVGAPSVRYGRDPITGLYRRGGHSGGGRGYADTPDGQGHAGDVKGGMAMRAMAAMKYLVEKKGYTPEGAAIAVGNAMQESSVNAGTRPGDHGISHSMFQWNHERWAAYQKFSAGRGKSTSDNENALDFFDEERKHRSGLEAQWHKQTDLHNAGRLGHLFEGYGDNSEGARVQNARNMLDLWKKQHPGTTPPAHANGGRIRGPGGPRSDSIFAMLSNGEFVVNARDAQRHAGLLQAINSGGLPAFADGGLVAAGRARRKSWLNFFQRPAKDGGMGASRSVAFGATAMMNGESGWGLNPSIYHWDVNGPSGGAAQWHDVTKGPWAGKLHRLSDLMTFAMQQHADWKDTAIQQAWWKHEAKGPLAFAWEAMRHAKSAAGTLKVGIDKFENPAHHDLELTRRLPNIIRLAQEAGGGNGAREIDPIDIHFHHHQDGRVKSIRTKTGRGVRVHLARGPTFAAASETD